MAIVKGLWLDRKDRTARIKKVQAQAKVIARRIAKREADEVERQTFITLDNEIKRLNAINDCETNVALFAYRYFSDEQNPDNGAGNIIRNSENGEPHETLEELAPIHRDFYDISDKITAKKRNGNYVIAAPRGHAKTQIFSVITTLHELAYRKRQYGLIISETDSLSKKIVASIAAQLKYNAKLREDFGELLYIQSLKNIKDNEEAFITSTNALVEASSAGKSLRGKTHGSGFRPDWIVLDDISSSANEATEAQREKLKDWFNSVVVPLGGKDTATVFVGTMVSATGLLAHLLKRRDFESTFHQAIEAHAVNRDLWQQYEHLYTTEDDYDLVEEFYREHEEEMNEGVKLAWPQRWTYRELMHRKINMGARAFASEFMNESFAEDETVFNPDKYEYYTKSYEKATPTVIYNDKYIPYSQLEITGAWDVAMAANSRSALNAFVTVGRDRQSGRLFVLDVYATREVPSVFMEGILDRMREFNHGRVVVEGIGAYADFHRQLQELARINRIYSSRIELLKSHGKKSKESRLEMLEPMFANKTIVLNNRHTVLLDQLRQYPHGLVDALDALSMAVEAGGKRKARVTQKPSWL